MQLRHQSLLPVLLLAGSLCTVGCGSNAAHPDASVQPDGPVAAEPGAAVSLALELSSYFQLDLPRAAAVVAAPASVQGTLTVVRTSDGQVSTFNWNVTLDEETWDIDSDKTILLAPDTYQFTLLLSIGQRQYAGQAVVPIQEGENPVSLTVRPILGELAIQPGVTELAEFRLGYPAEQLGGLSNPRFGVIIDGGPEQIVSLNPATGRSDLYISVPDGSHRIQLRLYDGSIQRGRSLTAQETVLVRGGQDLVMDIVPLHGETEFELDEQGGQLAIRIQVPGVVVEEVGGLDSLAARFSFTCPNSAPIERTLALVPLDSGDHRAELVLDDVQYGVCAYALAFVDLSTSPEEQVASCSQTVELGRDDQSVSCDLLLRRRALIGGEILAVVALNVFDGAWAPVAGAVVSEDAKVLGITGAGAFGSPGYLKLHLPAGNHRLTALHPGSMRFGQAALDVAPLEIHNLDIQLLQTTTACSTSPQCPPPSFVPITECQGFDDVCDQSGMQAGDSTTHACITGGCIPETQATIQDCVRDTNGVGCADTELGPWSDCGSFSDTCDESGARTRSRTDYTCSAGACTAVAGTDTEACARDTDGVICGPPSYGDWSACTFDGDVCDETGTQTRTITEYVCAGASCAALTKTQTQACTRDTDSTTCGTTTYGNWSACTFDSGVCDTTGTQSRTATDYVCAGASCTAVTRTETQACTRAPTDCGPPSEGPWGPCVNVGDACDSIGTQSRTVTDPQCSADACVSVSWTESQSCYVTPLDCGGFGAGPWSACNFEGGACDTEGTRTRTWSGATCVGSGCVGESWTESETCTRAPGDCGGPSAGPWGPCVNVGSACSPVGIQSRTVTDPQCSGDACVPVSWTESQSCHIPPLSCGGPSVGPWGPCAFEGDVCDTTGTQTRTVTTFQCSGNGCVPTTSTETQTCTRGSPGSCGAPSYGGWSECSDFDSECDQDGTQSRTVTQYLCSGDSCAAFPSTETQGCWRNTDGAPCDSGWGTCSNGTCIINPPDPGCDCPSGWYCCFPGLCVRDTYHCPAPERIEH